jgi:hypothetical protein
VILAQLWPGGLSLAPDALAALAQVWCSHLALGYLLERPLVEESGFAGLRPWGGLAGGLALFVGLNALLLPVGQAPGLVLLAALVGLGLWRLLARWLEHRARRLPRTRGWRYTCCTSLPS